jgi:hypothetical protein
VNDDDKDALLRSVNILLTRENAVELYAVLMEVSAAHARFPDYVTLYGEACELVPLLRLRRKNIKKFQQLIDFIEALRLKAGAESLQKPYDKTQYMRDFMDAKRQRQRRAVEVENMLRPPRDALKGIARAQFSDAQSAKWKAALDEKLESVRASLPHADGRPARLPLEMMNQIRKDFWTSVDHELAQLEELARKEQFNVGKVGKKSASAADLQRVLEHDPYKK